MGWFDTFKKDFREDYLNKIFRNSIEDANAIRRLAEDKSFEQNKQGLSDTEWLSIVFEFIYFYLHLTDRFAFEHMSEEQRAVLMTGVERICISSAVNAVCRGWPKDKKEKIKEECMENFHISMQEYSKYKKWLAEKGEGTKNTLFWEFGKMIAKLAGREMDARYIMLSVKIAIDSLKDLDIKSFIEKVK